MFQCCECRRTLSLEDAYQDYDEKKDPLHKDPKGPYCGRCWVGHDFSRERWPVPQVFIDGLLEQAVSP